MSSILRKQNIKKMIINQPIPSHDEIEVKRLIDAAKKIKFHPERMRMTEGEFFVHQIRFIKKRTWFFKVLLTILVSGVMVSKQIDMSDWIWTLITVLGPLICLTNANEICNIYLPNMLEIHLTAKYSLRKVFMVRLVVFGIVDSIILLFCIWIIKSATTVLLWQILIYAIGPFNIMNCGCMMILNREKEENAALYCTVWGLLMILAILFIKIMGFEAFESYNLVFWIIIAAAGFCVTIYEASKLLKKSGGNSNEIKHGTFIETF